MSYPKNFCQELLGKRIEITCELYRFTGTLVDINPLVFKINNAYEEQKVKDVFQDPVKIPSQSYYVERRHAVGFRER